MIMYIIMTNSSLMRIVDHNEWDWYWSLENKLKSKNINIYLIVVSVIEYTVHSMAKTIWQMTSK